MGKGGETTLLDNPSKSKDQELSAATRPAGKRQLGYEVTTVDLCDRFKGSKLGGGRGKKFSDS